jgi:hypothetical protein
MEYVLVDGIPVVIEGKLVEGAEPGDAVRAPIRLSR